MGTGDVPVVASARSFLPVRCKRGRHDVADRALRGKRPADHFILGAEWQWVRGEVPMWLPGLMVAFRSEAGAVFETGGARQWRASGHRAIAIRFRDTERQIGIGRRNQED